MHVVPFSAGLASLSELEEARRFVLGSENAVLLLRQERLHTWVQLYVALGGGFEPTQLVASAQNTSKQSLVRETP